MVRGLLILVLVGWPVFALAAEAGDRDQVDYATHIKPLLASRCVACHGALKQAGGLRLDTAKLANQGGDSGPAFRPGDAAASLLIERVTSADSSLRMPQEGEPLAPAEIAHLRRWIDINAPAPADERPEPDPRDHWAFRPPVRPALPTALSPAHAAWVRNPIDAFVVDKQAAHGIAPAVEATREVLIRRVYLGLVGVPPTLEEWNTWQTAPDTHWYEQLVDRLLEDPRHGERWARHWMDIWRYSDWWGLGDQLRNSQYHIWHWRDWIIESLNADLPYDEMVRLMLAADESHPNDLQRLRATGFLARNYFLFNRHQWLDETVEHVSKGLLGLTINCAKCHDHKYDPIEQVDYYRMRAFFEPYHARQDMVPGEVDLARDGIPRAFDGVLDAPTYLLERGQEAQPDRSKVIAPGIPAALAFAELNIAPIPLPAEAWQPARRPWVIEAYLSACQRQIATADAALKAAQATLASAQQQLATSGQTGEAAQPSTEAAQPVAEAAECRIAELALAVATAEQRSVDCRAKAMRATWAKIDAPTEDPTLAAAERATTVEAVVAERQVALAKAELDLAKVELRLAQAKTEQKDTIEKEVATARDAVAKATQAAAAEVESAATYSPLVGAQWTPTRFLSSTADDPQVTFPPQSSGRRTALARWITDTRNPLTARVAVNHLWNRHFGTPLVATVFDFGRKGATPVQRELLDWLAVEFVESGWSMKHLHRLIATSATYRLSSSLADAAESANQDAENMYLGRRTPMRLESQVVRDSILALSGTLDTAIGGPAIVAADQATSTRRSLYFFHSNNDRDRFLLTFDEASVKECYRRDQSIVPQQALALANSRLVHDALGSIAQRISTVEGADIDDAEFVRRAFLALLGMQATDAEVAACLRSLEQWRSLPTDGDATAPGAAPRARLIWALINHNDFVTLR